MSGAKLSFFSIQQPKQILILVKFKSSILILRNFAAENEKRDHNGGAAGNSQRIHDLRMVRPPQTAADEGAFKQYASLCLKVLQEAITLVIFTVFTILFFKGESLQWNHFAAFGCLIAAVYLVFMK